MCIALFINIHIDIAQMMIPTYCERERVKGRGIYPSPILLTVCNALRSTWSLPSIMRRGGKEEKIQPLPISCLSTSPTLRPLPLFFEKREKEQHLLLFFFSFASFTLPPSLPSPPCLPFPFSLTPFSQHVPCLELWSPPWYSGPGPVASCSSSGKSSGGSYSDLA